MAKIGELVVDIVGDNSSLDTALKDSTKQTNTFASTAGKAFASLGASVAVFAGLVRGIEFNKAAEQAKVAFTVMTGSAKTAEKTLRELKDYANKTPLEFKDIRDATQTLIQFGLGAEEAVSTVKMLGDVSGGNAERLKSLAVAMGQISSSSRLNGQDLNQLINSGFNPLLEISNKTGRSMADLKKDMENGAISADMVKESFKRATSEGGQFFGMLEKQSETLSGKLSTMNDAIDTSLGSLTEAFTPFIKGFADVVTTLLGAFSALPKEIQAFVGSLALIGAALLAAIPVVQLFGVTLTASMGPIAAITAGVIALGVAITSSLGAGQARLLEDLQKRFGNVASSTNVSAESLDDFAKKAFKAEVELRKLKGAIDKDSIEKIAKELGLTAEQVAKIGLASKTIQDPKGVLKGLVDEYTKIGNEQRKNVAYQQMINDQKAKEAILLKDAKVMTDAQTKAQKDYADAQSKITADQKKASDERRKSGQEEIDRLNDTEQEKLDIRRKELMAFADTAQRKKEIDEWYRAESLKITDKTVDEKYDAWKTAFEEEEALRDANLAIAVQAEIDSLDEQIKALEQAEANKKAIWEASKEAFFSIVSSLSEIFRASKEQEIADLQSVYDKDMELLENGGITRKERLEQDLADAKASGDKEKIEKANLEISKYKITEEFEKKKAKLKYESDLATWAASLVQSIANAALSITGIWANHGAYPPVAAALTAISGAATALQIGAIASNKPQPPKLWTGTTNPFSQDTPAIVADQGMEMIIPKGATVLNNRDTMSALGGNNQPMRATIQFMMDSVLVAEKTADIFNNGIVRLELA